MPQTRPHILYVTVYIEVQIYDGVNYSIPYIGLDIFIVDN